MPVVFVTGGARRIGRGLALGFAAKGYDVGITYRSSEKAATTTLGELRDLGVRAEAVRCDVTNESELHSALKTLAGSLGTPDVIVSNAGVFPEQRSLTELTPDDLRATMDINTVPLLTVARTMHGLRSKESSLGRIVAISSLGAFELWKERIDYNVSKASLVKLVQALAREMAPSITVNSVAPGAIIMDDQPSDTDDMVAGLGKIPMDRYGSAEDVFDAVWFFAGASSYVTGENVTVDGGYRLIR